MAKKEKKAKDVVEKKTKLTKEVKKEKKKQRKNEGYLKEVRHEMKKVTFPKFKEVMKYTLATIVFCLVLVGFFLLLNLLLSVVKGMF